MRPHDLPPDLPPEVRKALAPFAQWLVALVIEAIATHAKGSEGPRYYDATNAPMGKTAFLRLAGQGAFPSFKVGKRVRAKADDVHAYMEAQQGAKSRAPRAPVAVPPIDVNDLSPAELHELEMGRALPHDARIPSASRRGNRA